MMSAHDKPAARARPGSGTAANGRPSGHRLADLQEKSVAELVGLCDEANVRPDQIDRHELVLALLNEYARRRERLEGTGILEVLPDGFGFMRSPAYDYVPGVDDCYVSPSQIRRFHLGTGHSIEGELRPPKGTEKYFALVKVSRVNGRSPERDNLPFGTSPPRPATEPIALQTSAATLPLGKLDVLAPIGKGHRGLLIAAPGTGRTSLLRGIAEAACAADRSLHVILVLIDERPEETAESQELLVPLGCEVVSAAFGEPTARQVHAAAIVLERAKRLAEDGGNVLVLLDSMTALVRAHNIEATPSGRPVATRLLPQALIEAKRYFATPRQLDNGGSLTLIAAAREAASNRLDAAIIEELAPAANLVIRLDPELAQRGTFPAIDVAMTRTRRPETFLGKKELAAMRAASAKKSKSAS